MPASIQTVQEHTIYVKALHPDAVVLDLGANQGLFSLAIADRFGCRCYAFEPAVPLFDRIPAHDRIEKHNVAVAGREGQVQFHLCDDPLGSTLSPVAGESYHDVASVEARSLERLADDLGLCDIALVKMDIEGAELEVLDACSDRFLKNLGQLTIEFHDFNGATPEPEVRRRIERLRALGFLVYKKTWRDWGDVLLVNPDVVDISPLDFVWNKYVLRYWTGAGRVLRKLGRGEA